MGVMAAYAQPAAPPDAAQRAAEMAKALKLSSTQAASMKTILDAEQAAMQALRTQRDTITRTTKQNLAKLLSAEQLGRFEEWKQTHRPPRPTGDGDRGGDRDANNDANRRPAPRDTEQAPAKRRQ